MKYNRPNKNEKPKKYGINKVLNKIYSNLYSENLM